MPHLIRLDAYVIRRTLALTAVSTVIAVTLVCAAYLALHGYDDRFYDAMGFALVVPFFCAVPIGLVTHSQHKRQHLLFEELQEATKEAETLNRRLAHEASHDAMTGLLNRKYFLEALTACRCDNCPDSLLLIDADRFKAINDRFGHHTGDEALIRMAKLIAMHLQPDDVLSRIGGEEFAVLLKDKPIGEAWLVAESIRQSIYSEKFRANNGEPCQLSVSIGINNVHSTDQKYPLRKVDLALYEAKSRGRNRTIKFEPSMDIPTSERYSDITGGASA